jgi:hypothetical protein
MICGLNDLYSFRLVIQCSAGDEDEDPSYRAAHTSMGHYDTCFCAMHVGCAVWGRNDVGEFPNNRRVYFFPGLAKVIKPTDNASDEATDLSTVTRIYCPVHATELQRANVVGADIVRYPNHLRPTPHPDMTSNTRTNEEMKHTTTFHNKSYCYCWLFVVKYCHCSCVVAAVVITINIILVPLGRSFKSFSSLSYHSSLPLPVVLPYRQSTCRHYYR